MLFLRDGLSLALLLNRRPVIVIPQSGAPLHGRAFTDFFALGGGATTINSSTPFTVGSTDSVLLSKVSPGQVVVTSSQNTTSLIELLQRPLPNSTGVRETLAEILTLHEHTHEQFRKLLRQLQREGGAASAAASLLLADPSAAPDCWSSPFMRPARRVREAVAPVMFGVQAAIHIRACTQGQDTCTRVDATGASIALLRCACPSLATSASDIVGGHAREPLIFASSDR